ncbi:hypothetical protein [Altericista sp. CCNU0014]|uniref:hypothetical protein n=1 Tax=Altericista sp. CCNU0014 TaxID=3082949 RepID=UPI00384BEFDE
MLSFFMIMLSFLKCFVWAIEPENSSVFWAQPVDRQIEVPMKLRSAVAFAFSRAVHSYSHCVGLS